MNSLRDRILSQLRASRKALLDIPKNKLSGKMIVEWQKYWDSEFNRARSITDIFTGVHISTIIRGSENETGPDVCLDLRTLIVNEVDEIILKVDSKQIVTPILDDLISKIADTKLSTLLKEFSACKDNQPNSAATIFRTIVPLIIRERARIIDPKHSLATKDDIGFEGDIKMAINHPTLFSQAENKLIKNYFNGGNKVSFDNVVHKPDYLIEKTELSSAVDLLNRILPRIIE
ncbi:MAG: hypothetical protein WCP11_03075 [Candidatus Saccharibacteria bacterium]